MLELISVKNKTLERLQVVHADEKRFSCSICEEGMEINIPAD